MAPRLGAAVLLASAGVSAAVKQRSFLSTNVNLQPQAVARTLQKVEDEWREQATAFVACNSSSSGGDCSHNSLAFEHSCGTVVQAMMTASSGDRSTLQEYLKDVCGQEELRGWKQRECEVLTLSVLNGMGQDAYQNRESFDVSNSCYRFWQHFLEDEKMHMHEVAEQQAAVREAEKRMLAARKKEEAKAIEKATAVAKAEEKVTAARRAREEKEEKDIKAAELKAKRLAEKAAARHSLAMSKEDEVSKAIAAARKTVEEAKEIPKYSVGVSSEPWVTSSNSSIPVAASHLIPTSMAATNSTKVR